MMKIRLEKPEDFKAVENLIRESFWNVYRPGCLEHFLMHELRKTDEFIKELDFVLEVDDTIIGQAAFVRSVIQLLDGRFLLACTLGPICIDPKYQKLGYGKILLDYAIVEASKLGYKAILLEGNFDFYSKCGFKKASDYNIKYHGFPEGEDQSFFLCRELQEGVLNNIKGEYATPVVYLVNENNLEEFDKQFPKKIKKKLPGQLFL